MSIWISADGARNFGAVVIGEVCSGTSRPVRQQIENNRFKVRLLPQHGAMRVHGARGLNVHDVPLSRVFLLRGASPLPCGVVPRVHDVLLPCDDAPPPFLT